MSPNSPNRGYAPISPKFREFPSYLRVSWFAPGFNVNGDDSTETENIINADGGNQIANDGVDDIELIYVQ